MDHGTIIPLSRVRGLSQYAVAGELLSMLVGLEVMYLGSPPCVWELAQVPIRALLESGLCQGSINDNSARLCRAVHGAVADFAPIHALEGSPDA